MVMNCYKLKSLLISMLTPLSEEMNLLCQRKSKVIHLDKYVDDRRLTCLEAVDTGNLSIAKHLEIH